MVNGRKVLHGVCVAVLLTCCYLPLPLPRSLITRVHLVTALTSFHCSHPNAANEAQKTPGIKSLLVSLLHTNYSGEYYFALKNWVIAYTKIKDSDF